jgi:hypothetical protein
MPSHHKKSVEMALSQGMVNLRRVTTTEAISAGAFRNIAQEERSIALKKIDVPMKSFPEPRCALLIGRRLMAVEDGQIQLALELSKQRRMVLNGV